MEEYGGCTGLAYSYIQQSGRSVKSMNAKNMNKSPIHENADANITCDFGDGDIIRCHKDMVILVLCEILICMELFPLLR